MHTVLALWRDLLHNPWQPRYIYPLVIINLAGSAYGYWWYRGQLAETMPLLWPLVADSPLSTTFFTLALAFAARGRQISLFTALGAATTVKYGLWALVILTHYWLAGGEVRLVELGLWAGHLGMALEGWIFARRAVWKAWVAAGVILWVFGNDVVDYIFELHPYLFLPGQRTLALVAAVVLSFVAALLVWARKG